MILDAKVHHAIVEVLTAQVGVTGGGLHLKNAIFDGQQRHVEGASAHVVDPRIEARLLERGGLRPSGLEAVLEAFDTTGSYRREAGG